jgi:hypothetical protein
MKTPTISEAGKAFAHPLRIAIFTELVGTANAEANVARRKRRPKDWKEWQGTSPNEFAKLLDEPLTNISYHVRMLHDLGVIELAHTEPRRGALEHYYKPTCDIKISVAARNGTA